MPYKCLVCNTVYHLPDYDRCSRLGLDFKGPASDCGFKSGRWQEISEQEAIKYERADAFHGRILAPFEKASHGCLSGGLIALGIFLLLLVGSCVLHDIGLLK
jgi:hypothetical protein